GVKVSNGGTEFTFTLRKGVKSEFDNELTSNDVKWTFDRLAAHNRGIISLQRISRFSSLTIIDKYTFKLTTSGPSPILLIQLDNNPRFVPIDSVEASKHATTSDPWADAWLAEHAAGFGPYKLASWTKGQEETFEVKPGQQSGWQPGFKRVRVL